jgi:phosphopantetheinyl transferase
MSTSIRAKTHPIVMAFYKSIAITQGTTAYFWSISEALVDLQNACTLTSKSELRLETMKAESQQKGFLAVRMLLQHIGLSDADLSYDSNGKPHLQNGKHISISHSHLFSVIAISDQPVGIDIELIKEKTLKIAPRYLDVSHLEELSVADQTIKATIIWGIKEAVFKIKSQPGISFPNHIFESDFAISDQKTKAQLRFNDSIENFNIVFETLENYAFVCALPQLSSNV